MTQRVAVLVVLILLPLGGCGVQERAFHAPQAAPKDEAAPGKAAKPAGGKPDGGEGAARPAPRKIIYTGFVDVLVDDFDRAEQRLRELVAENDGYPAGSEMRNQPGSPRAGTWTVRVPTRNFDAFLQGVSGFGEVRKRTTNSQDITDAYHDSAARLKADEAEEKSLLGLLEKTQGRVEDILKVRDQLRVVRGQIEERKSQLQRWDKDVDLATVTVQLQDRRDYTPPLAPDFGKTLSGTFRGSVDALAAFGRGLILVAVALAPWLAVLAALLGPVYLLARRRRAAAPMTALPVAEAAPPDAPSEGAAP